MSFFYLTTDYQHNLKCLGTVYCVEINTVFLYDSWRRLIGSGQLMKEVL